MEIQKGLGVYMYMRKGREIYEEMREYIRRPLLYKALHPDPFQISLFLLTVVIIHVILMTYTNVCSFCTIVNGSSFIVKFCNQVPRLDY